MFCTKKAHKNALNAQKNAYHYFIIIYTTHPPIKTPVDIADKTNPTDDDTNSLLFFINRGTKILAITKNNPTKFNTGNTNSFFI